MLANELSTNQRLNKNLQSYTASDRITDKIITDNLVKVQVFYNKLVTTKVKELPETGIYEFASELGKYFQSTNSFLLLIEYLPLYYCSLTSSFPFDWNV